MSVSMCGNSFSCLTFHDDGTLGTELNPMGGDNWCSRCMGSAIDILEFIVGESIEFVSVFDEWEQSSKIQERLESMLLFHALRPQLEQLAAMRS